MLNAAADDRAALQFEDLASLLDAGLMPGQIAERGSAAAGAQGEGVLQALLAERGVRLSPAEDAMLGAAWSGGRATAALRERARVRRVRAEFARTVWAGLRYPIVLVLLVVLSSVVSGAVTGRMWFAYVALAVVAASVAFAWLAVRGVRRGGAQWLRVPLLGRIAADLGELPYLETLHGLYAAGVPLLDAHARAVAVVPIAAVRAPLEAADRILHANRPLGEALLQSGALGRESRELLATGERAGDLEGALRRAHQRRSDVASRNAANLARRVGQVAYFLAVVLVVVTLFSFYSGYFAKMSAALRR